MRFEYQTGEHTHVVELERVPDGYRATIDGTSYELQLLQAEPGRVTIMLGDRAVTNYVGADGPRRWVFLNGDVFLLNLPSPTGEAALTRRADGHAHAGERALAAPMPGQVRAVQVQQGDPVKKGQTLILLEAMKMEIRIQAPRDGQVAGLLVQPGQTVEREQVLIEIE